MKKLVVAAASCLVFLLALVTLAASFTSPVQAAGVLDRSCSVQGGGGDRSSVCGGSQELFGSGGIWSNIVGAVIFLIGAVAVIMIIIGAIKYTTANGDQSQLTSAKNTIIYSLVGLILAIAAGGIISFVLERL